MGKISSMQTASTLNTTDIIPVVQGSGNSFANKKTTIANLSDFIFNNEGISPEEITGLADDVDDLKSADTALENDIGDLKSAMNLLHDEIPNTVQTYTFTDGSVSQVLHKSGNTTVRTDTFTYATNTITEVRTLNTGESLTIVTNLQTLETAVTYAAA